jgi:hypothetical protein
MNLSAARLSWLYLRGALWWMGLGLFAVGTAILLIIFSLWQDEQGFEASSVQVEAKVTRKETRTVMRGKKGNTPTIIHVLVYTFPDEGGQQHEGKADVSSQTWGHMKKGDRLILEYDRTNPASTRLAGRATPVRLGLLATGGIGLLFATFGIVTAACLLIRSAQRVRLIQTGMPALGIVEEVIENDSALKLEGTYRVTYRFTDPQGESWEGRGPPQSWSLASRWDKGETILVLYDPRNPSRNEADLFEARSEDLTQLQDS